MYEAKGSQARQCWRYSVVHESLHDAEIGEYGTYGIKATGPDSITTLHDVSISMDAAATMTEKFNRYRLSIYHLMEAIEDSIA